MIDVADGFLIEPSGRRDVFTNCGPWRDRNHGRARRAEVIAKIADALG